MISRVLVLGSGQLGLMMAAAGSRLGIVVDRLDMNTEELLPGTSDRRYPLGQDDLPHLLERYPVITAEVEHLPQTPLVTSLLASDAFLQQAAFVSLPDRQLQKQLLDSLSIPSARWLPWSGIEGYSQVVETLGQGARIKRRRGGYDGRGQWTLTGPDSCPGELGADDAIVEQHVSFDRELSLVGARGRDGSAVFYPLVENQHDSGILRQTLAPALVDEKQQVNAQAWLHALMNHLDYVGVMAMELFDTDEGLVVNELAPRVHNSGHWSQEGASHCQFELHLRAICDLPLPEPEMKGFTAMINIIGSPWCQDWYQWPGVQVHWYGKSVRPGRKLGHLNLCAPNRKALQRQLNELPGDLFRLV